MRLIDGDKLNEEFDDLITTFENTKNGKDYINKEELLECLKLLRGCVDEQPTAYDISKVEAELDELMVKTTSKMVESKEVPEWFYEVKTGEYINKKETIDIVRKGGIE